MATRTELQAEGDRDLRERLLAERDIQTAIQLVEKQGIGESARRHLLATATRLTAEMAPEVHAIIDHCRTTLGVTAPLEIFVYPDPRFNAAAVRPERGRLLLMLSSALLEGFEPSELRFVVGHEVGHYLFDHHHIPTGVLLAGGARIAPALALQLFAWQRYAEISADRAGLVCAGGLEPAAHGLFKLASGLHSGRVKVQIEQFMAQFGDLQEEAESHATGDEKPRGDWFSTHPFSPLRLKAAQLCAGSEIMTVGGMPRARLEAEVQELMALMDPSYLSTKTGVAETMRRLLFAGGVAIASVTGVVDRSALDQLEKLLGPGAIPIDLRPDLIASDLPDRIAAVNREVPPLRRSQVIRDLCVIARADGEISPAEAKVIRDIAAAVDVEERVVTCTIDPTGSGCT